MTDLDGPGTIAGFLRATGVSRQRCGHLRQAGVIRGVTLAEWISSYVENLRQQAAGRAQDAALRDAKTRKAIAQAELAEIRAGLERGDVVRRSDAIRLFTSILRAARDRFRGLPARLAAELVPMDDERVIADRLAASIDEVLHDLADSGGRVTGEKHDEDDDAGGRGPGDGGVPAADGANRRRPGKRVKGVVPGALVDAVGSRGGGAAGGGAVGCADGGQRRGIRPGRAGDRGAEALTDA